jgi:hypothetical protein
MPLHVGWLDRDRAILMPGTFQLACAVVEE